MSLQFEQLFKDGAFSIVEQCRRNQDDIHRSFTKAFQGDRKLREGPAAESVIGFQRFRHSSEPIMIGVNDDDTQMTVHHNHPSRLHGHFVPKGMIGKLELRQSMR
ncbi:MAG: hypothetical protein OXG02_07520 [Chloroflexi bacterium]|nr:hypothetical protein [Chloroflexota bacterium]MCY4008586.1 hypothetical protein [Anaerolineaceae bacterium]MCY4106536.1 hypothetical protein [Chloroflexota bacterium]